MADKVQMFKNKIINIKHFYIYLFAIISSLLTFLFFYFAKSIFKEEENSKRKYRYL